MINVVNQQVNLAILALLVGFALTAETVVATNESSYRLGLQYGYNENEPHVTVSRWNCQNSPHVDNVTACIDGYIHAWSHAAIVMVHM